MVLLITAGTANPINCHEASNTDDYFVSLMVAS